MKSMTRIFDDHGVLQQSLAFICPGCKEDGGTGLHLIGINNTVHKPSWTWNGDLEKPTLTPSILTKTEKFVCHCYLTDGVFKFLEDSTHSLSGQEVPMPDLPEWFTKGEA